MPVGGSASHDCIGRSFRSDTAKAPPHEQIDPTHSTRKMGMAVGEIRWGDEAAINFVQFSFFGGLPLASLKDDVLTFHSERVNMG